MSSTEFAMVSVPAAPIRKQPGHRYEMTNQILFGESVQVIDKKDDLWVNVQTVFDGYSGWITTSMIIPTTEDAARNSSHILAGNLLNTLIINGQPMQVPLGAALPNLKDNTGRIGQVDFTFNGVFIDLHNLQNKPALLIRNAMQWINAPYLWGGKTILGVDCSGFSQTMYKLIGYTLPRDAWQQSEQGTLIKDLSQIQSGDLAFFDDKEEIVHVGILLGGNKIIHASGKVRIDLIDKHGITNCETGQQTHTLKLIRRYLNDDERAKPKP